jgi:hypothetical protein
MTGSRARRRVVTWLALACLWLPVPSASAAPQPAGARYDLTAAERLGGHTLARHVGRTDEDLRERLRRQPGISAASTYTDRETAERTIALALQQQRGRVRAWASKRGGHANLALDYDGDPSVIIGRSLARGERRVQPCWDAIVVLRWDGDGAYHVLTSYPERRR